MIACARVRSDTSRLSISAARLKRPLGLGPYALGLAQHIVGAPDRFLYAMLPGALIELGQLRPERRQPGREVIGPQPLRPDRIQRIARGQQSLPRPLHGRAELCQLRLGGLQQRPQPLREPVELALDPVQLLLGPRQIDPRPRNSGAVQIIPVQIVGVDRGDIAVTHLVDPPPEAFVIGGCPPRLR